jgi:hypothetical protein
MSAAASPHDTELLDPAEARALRQARRLARLERLAELGMELAELLCRRVAQAAEPAGPARHEDDAVVGEAVVKVELAFSRLARAVRLTDALASRLEADGLKLELKLEAAADGPPADDAPASEEAGYERMRLRLRRLMVQDDTLRAIEAEARGDVEHGEALLSGLYERLYELTDEDLLAVPVGVMIARLCQAIGVPYDPHHWGDDPADTAHAGTLDQVRGLQHNPAVWRNRPPGHAPP